MSYKYNIVGNWHRLVEIFCTIGIFLICKDYHGSLEMEKNYYLFSCLFTVSSITLSITMFTIPCNLNIMKNSKLLALKNYCFHKFHSGNAIHTVCRAKTISPDQKDGSSLSLFGTALNEFWIYAQYVKLN